MGRIIYNLHGVIRFSNLRVLIVIGNLFIFLSSRGAKAPPAPALATAPMAVEAVRGQIHYNEHALWHSNSMFGSLRNAISGILEPRLKILISSFYYC